MCRMCTCKRKIHSDPSHLHCTHCTALPDPQSLARCVQHCSSSARHCRGCVKFAMGKRRQKGVLSRASRTAQGHIIGECRRLPKCRPGSMRPARTRFPAAVWRGRSGHGHRRTMPLTFRNSVVRTSAAACLSCDAFRIHLLAVAAACETTEEHEGVTHVQRQFPR